MYNQYEINLTQLITGRARSITLFANCITEAAEKMLLIVPELQIKGPTHTVQITEIEEPDK